MGYSGQNNHGDTLKEFVRFDILRKTVPIMAVSGASGLAVGVITGAIDAATNNYHQELDDSVVAGVSAAVGASPAMTYNGTIPDYVAGIALASIAYRVGYPLGRFIYSAVK